MLTAAAAARCAAPSVRCLPALRTTLRPIQPASLRCSSTSTSSSDSHTPAPESDAAPSSSTSSSSSPSGHAGASGSANHSAPGGPSFSFEPPRPRRGKVRRAMFVLGWIPVAAFITSHLYSLGNVTGGSMSPTFNGPYAEASAANARADVVLLNRSVSYQHNELRPGDIVTLISPLDPRLLLTKRVIALPGDTVRVWAPGASTSAGKWTRIKIPPGHVWVEGDAAVDIVPRSLEKVANSARLPAGVRNKSRDSREFGPVPMGLITSKIDWIVWPPKRFGPPGPRPTPAPQRTQAGQYPPSLTEPEDRSTQVNPSLARILDEMTQLAPGARAKAHPEDSVISPYIDWNDPNAEPEAHDIDAGTAESGVLEKAGEARKTAWNGLSRGGRLGDDAD
ncbi:mitochondrial inner membrane protease, subunit IMP2 [Moesziomyces antarcticus T-34]|uniref:Mitochondrial inner membrane protease subunit 2 n=1 Tax=Pseudozyma antarctica (strain T-34) TaxID=1151754 RepID=M9M743_PSEA3|nr:mitochondrial inner membrane protease, subunit IMP2 [Moesziomyces antarcticus T-34]